MSYTYEKRTGIGCTLGWDSTGGTTYVALGTVVDGDKFEAMFKTANTSLLSDVGETFAKTSYDPGTFKFTVIYDPLASDYTNLKTNFALVNALAPHWQISFPDTGSGSGATTDAFFGHIVGLSRELKKGDFLVCEITVKITGTI